MINNNSIFKLSVLALNLVSVSACATVRDTKEQQLQLMSEVVNDYCEKELFFGMSYVTTKEKVFFEQACGKQDIVYGTDNHVKSKFRIGSNTKAMTTAVFLPLVQEKLKKAGKSDELSTYLKNQTIGDYLPWYPQNQCADISLHNLMIMSSGIPDYSNNPQVYLEQGFATYKGNKHLNLNGPQQFTYEFCSCSEESMAAALSGTDKTFTSGQPYFEPGTQYDYSNCNYYILGNIIEQIVNESSQVKAPEGWFGSIVEEKIFTPTKMKDSGVSSRIQIYSDMTTGYVWREFPSVERIVARMPPKDAPGRFPEYPDLILNPPSNPLVLYAAGELYSTVTDMHKWDQVLYTDKILTPELKQLVYFPYNKIPAPDVCAYYGYGWVVTFVDPNNPGMVTNCPDIANEETFNGYEKVLNYSASYPYAWYSNYSRLLDRDQMVGVFTNYDKYESSATCIASELRNILIYGKKLRSKGCTSVIEGTFPGM